MTKVTRPVTDTLNDAVYKPGLDAEVKANGTLVGKFQYLTIEGFAGVPTIAYYFTSALTGPEDAALSGVTASHDGVVPPNDGVDAGDVGADPAGTAAAEVASHEGLPDPHPQYTDAAEAAAAAPVQSVNAQTGAVVLGAGDVGADPAGTAAAAVGAHEGLPDPHPQYTDAAEAAAAAPVQSVNTQTGAVVLGAGDVGADPAGTAAAAVSAHEGLPDPHPQYTDAAEAAAAAPVQSVNTQTGAVVLGAGDVGADPAGTAASAVSAHEGLPDPHPQYTDAAEAAAAAPVQSVNGQTGAVVIPSGAVDSVFGRTGVVVAQASDYDASQIDNDSSVAGATVADALDTLAASGRTAFAVWAEENAGLTAGAYEWAYGNGDDTVAGSGIPIALDCFIFALGLDHNTSASAEVAVELDGVQVATVTTTSERSNVVQLGAPVAVTAGQVLNFRTVNGPGSAAGNRVVAFLRTSNSSGVLAPVDSVNGQVGAVVLGAGDVGADPAGTGAAAASAAVATHEGLPDPHPQYTDAAEAAAAAPVQSVNTQTGAVVLGAGDVGADPAGTAAAAVAAHEGLPDPHPQYTDAAEAAAAAPVQTVNGQTGAVVLNAADVGADPAGSAATVQGNLDTHIADDANPHDTSLANILAGTWDDLIAAVNNARPQAVWDEAFDNPISTTTSTTFQNKVTLTTTKDYPPGTYIIRASYGWNHDSAGNDFEGQITFNGAQIGELHKQEPKDSAGGDPTGTTQRHYVTRDLHATVGATLLAGSTFALNYRTDAAGVESSIWEASLQIIRKT